jgi:RNA polymerase sigma factor (sigma-70 family)
VIKERGRSGSVAEIPPAATGPLEAKVSDESVQPDARAAIEAWMLATLARALAYATSLLRDRSLAEDVVHDCYVRLLEKAATYDLIRDGTKLLYTTITHACIDRNYRERRLLTLELGVEGDSQGNSPIAAQTAEDPYNVAVCRELEDALTHAMNRLSVAQRSAIELKSLGYSLDEIAAAIGISSVHAGVLVHRARKALTLELARFLESRVDE